MKKFTSIFVSLLFFVWILPLGAFIKPEKEEKACNGQRAICLCSHLLAKKTEKAAGKTTIKISSTQHQKDQSPSSAPDFLLSLNKNSFRVNQDRWFNNTKTVYRLVYIPPIEQVPKI